jgi:hypothetical protein
MLDESLSFGLGAMHETRSSSEIVEKKKFLRASKNGWEETGRNRFLPHHHHQHDHTGIALRKNIRNCIED